MKSILESLSAPLSKDDVELRIGTTSPKGFSLLLYKTARVDVKRLNESGAIWRNTHQYDEKGLLTCTISIYDPEHKIWIDRTDVGTESNTEKEKGLYSDSFKRCGFRWGIGLELYNAPFIWISKFEMVQYGNTWRPKGFFAGNLRILEYETKDGHFTKLKITYNDDIVFELNSKQQREETLSEYLKAKGVNAKQFCAKNNITTSEQAKALLKDKGALDAMIESFIEEK